MKTKQLKFVCVWVCDREQKNEFTWVGGEENVIQSISVCVQVRKREKKMLRESEKKRKRERKNDKGRYREEEKSKIERKRGREIKRRRKTDSE